MGEGGSDGPGEPLPRAAVLMGVSGSGKTTVGRIVARRLGWHFLDADDHHPPANRAKMRRGEALDEADRMPWLSAVSAAMGALLGEGKDLVVACSALRPEHRDLLRQSPPHETTFYWLDAPHGVLYDRLLERRDHFADQTLLESQLATLAVEEDDSVVRVMADAAPNAVAADILEHLAVN